jgi:hypothetical protein
MGDYLLERPVARALREIFASVKPETLNVGCCPNFDNRSTHRTLKRCCWL